MHYTSFNDTWLRSISLDEFKTSHSAEVSKWPEIDLEAYYNTANINRVKETIAKEELELKQLEEKTKDNGNSSTTETPLSAPPGEND